MQNFNNVSRIKDKAVKKIIIFKPFCKERFCVFIYGLKNTKDKITKNKMVNCNPPPISATQHLLHTVSPQTLQLGYTRRP